MKATELQFNKEYRCSCSPESHGYFSKLDKGRPVFADRKSHSVIISFYISSCKDGWEEIKDGTDVN